MSVSIECVFYQHVWAVHCLDKIGVRDDGKTLLVELCQLSNLAPVFDQQGKLRFGVAGLLSDPDRLSAIARRFKGVSAPLILGSRPAVPVATSVSGVSVLRSLPGNYDRIINLIHINEVNRFASALGQFDRFHVMLDIADQPSPLLPGVARTLLQLGVLSEASWGGMTIYEHPKRQLDDMPERRQQIEKHIEPYQHIANLSKLDDHS